MNFIKQLVELDSDRACIVQAKDKVYVFEIINNRLIDMRTNDLLDATFDTFADENIQSYICVDSELAELFLPYIK